MSQTFLLNDVMLGKYDNGVDANIVFCFEPIFVAKTFETLDV